MIMKIMEWFTVALSYVASLMIVFILIDKFNGEKIQWKTNFMFIFFPLVVIFFVACGVFHKIREMFIK